MSTCSPAELAAEDEAGETQQFRGDKQVQETQHFPDTVQEEMQDEDMQEAQATQPEEPEQMLEQVRAGLEESLITQAALATRKPAIPSSAFEAAEPQPSG